MAGYDPECAVLARHFLGAGAIDRLVAALAQRIQNEDEDWMETEAADLRRQLGIGGEDHG